MDWFSFVSSNINSLNQSIKTILFYMKNELNDLLPDELKEIIMIVGVLLKELGSTKEANKNIKWLKEK